jgi:hypothetical protein
LDRKNIWIRLLLLSFTCLLILVSKLEVAYAPEHRMIDLFTQKKPYDGKGLNQPSDAFAPQEEVILYANLTYREAAVPDKLVAFEIHGPVNPLNNITFSGTAMTNASGIATIDFRIPWPTENPEFIVFGTWKAYASADIAEVRVEDTLTFEGGWIVDILSIATVDTNFQPQTKFARGSCLGVQVVLKNIAMLPKKVTLTISAFDAMKVHIIGAIDDFEMNPCDTYIYTNCNLQIPEWVAIGNAMINASAYTAPLGLEGVPYCHEVSTTFLITVRDLAIISVIPSSTSVVAGRIVNVSVIVRNEGSNAETFNITAYANGNVAVIGDEILIGTQLVSNLASGNQTTITFAWNTSGFPEDTYRISAVASVLPGEIDINDNTCVNGTVVVGAMPVYAAPRELTIIALVAAVTIAMILIALLMSMRKKSPSFLLHVDVLQ